MLHQVGDLIRLQGYGAFIDGLYCEVLEVAPDDGRATKICAVGGTEILGKYGFFHEGDDWVIFELEILTAN